MGGDQKKDRPQEGGDDLIAGGIVHLTTGHGGVLMEGDRILELILPFVETRREVEEQLRRRGWGGEGSVEVALVLERLGRYMAGEPVLFDDVMTVEEGSPFRRRVREIVRSIPRGRVATYGEVALAAGCRNGARAVGRVMATNRTPLVVPCHRVLCEGGIPGHFSAPGGEYAKRRLLLLEGVEFADDGRVTPSSFHEF